MVWGTRDRRISRAPARFIIAGRAAGQSIMLGPSVPWGRRRTLCNGRRQSGVRRPARPTRLGSHYANGTIGTYEPRLSRTFAEHLRIVTRHVDLCRTTGQQHQRRRPPTQASPTRSPRPASSSFRCARPNWRAAGRLVRAWPLRNRELVERFCRLLDVLIHCEYPARRSKSSRTPTPRSIPMPTRRPAAELRAERARRRRGALFDRFGWLLDRGNFVRLAEEEIDRSVNDRSHWGLNLRSNFEIFDRLELYCRGDVIGTRFRRRLRNRFRSEAVKVPIYQRLVVIFRLRPEREHVQVPRHQDVYIKLFKDIPKADLDMLLPGTQVKMSLVDRARILAADPLGPGHRRSPRWRWL